MCLCESAVPIPFSFFSFSLKDKSFVWVQKGERSKQVGPAKCFLPGFVVAEPSYTNWQ